MKKMYGFIFFFIVLAAVCHGSRFGTAITDGGKAEISFRVQDDEQRPVEKARVQAGFYYDPEKQGIITGETDTNGLCTIKGMTCGDMWYSMGKSGYYKTEGRYLFGQVEPPVINNCWQPWNPTNTVVLKRIKNPIPMYVKKVEAVIPALNQPIGFDLEKGDWVQPCGNGIVPDFVFSEDSKYRTETDFESKLSLQFSKEEDGIQPVIENVGKDCKSIFSSQHEAPMSGYISKWTKVRSFDSKNGWNVSEKEAEIYYVFRVRTVLDEHKKIVCSRYGKIYGPIEYYYKPAGASVIRFTYYFNPDDTRNIEFDSEKNLFGGRDRFAP